MESTDVLVVGGGPAGAVAAFTAARAGARVWLLEARSIPRDKVCGDALIPDSLRLLEEVGLKDRVAAIAHHAEAVRIFSPAGRSFALRAPFLTVRRADLDALLCRAAVEAGVEMIEGARIEAPLRREGDGAVIGVRGRDADGRPLSLAAPITILATGAAGGMLRAFGVGMRSQPSALALRAYYRAPDLDPRELIISYERPVMPGYGWVFPMADGIANVGVGVFLAGGRTGANLRSLFTRFVEECTHVRALLANASPLGELRGAPLRCAFEGARTHADGLLVAGEAIGTTYSLTGEGIGKAMESGRHAGAVAAAAALEGVATASRLAAYDTALEAAGFRAKFQHYARAQRWVASAPVVDLLARRAERSARLRGVLEAVLREERSPRAVLSLGGIVRALVG